MGCEQKTVFRILTAAEWRDAQTQARVPMSDLDQHDGFVHLSTGETTLETANLYFDPVTKPVVIEIDAAALGADLRWEVVESRNNAVFPHLYANGIPLNAVSAVIELVVTDAGFEKGERRSHQ